MNPVRWFGSVVALMCGLTAGNAWSDSPDSLRVYFIGNSVTDTIKYEGLEQLAAGREKKLFWGRHMIPGAPLHWIWSHPEDGFFREPFGRYPQALAQHPWDVLCLQPFDRQMEGADGDVAMAKEFVKQALPQSPDLQVYVYARWPRKDKDGQLDYARQWSREYTGGWDSTNETKDYFERLASAIQKELPELKRPVRIVPVGHVMNELDRRMQQKEVPGLASIGEVYQDQIHLNHVGSYVVACTFHATLFGESTVGLSTEPYGPIDPLLARVIQETVWRVVATCPGSGVDVSETPQYTARADQEAMTPAAPKPTASKKAAGGSEQAGQLSRDQRYRQLVVGTWEDDFQGKRTMTLKADGTGTMIVELSGMKAALFASRLEFNMVWSLEDGRLKKRTIGGKPEVRVNMILKTMGDRVDEPILELTQKRLLLLDQDGETRYDWRRKE